jgi:hypothetical protein
MLEIYGLESVYYDPRDSLQVDIDSFKGSPNFKLLQPIECGKYTLNKLPACSYVATLNAENTKTYNILEVLAIGSNGIEYQAHFIASKDLYDMFLPSVEYMVKSISMNPEKVSSVLNVTSASNR